MQYYTKAICFICCLLPLFNYGQSSSLQDSVDLYSLNQPNKAIPFLKKLVKKQKDEKKWEKYVINIYNIAHNYYEAFDSENSQEYNKKAEQEAKKYLKGNNNITLPDGFEIEL